MIVIIVIIDCFRVFVLVNELSCNPPASFQKYTILRRAWHSRRSAGGRTRKTSVDGLALPSGISERCQRVSAPHPALDRNVHPYMPLTVVCTGKATFKKQNGTLQLTGSHITFTPDGKAAPTLKIPNTDHSCLYPHCSLLLPNSKLIIRRDQLCYVAKQEPPK